MSDFLSSLAPIFTFICGGLGAVFFCLFLWAVHSERRGVYDGGRKYVALLWLLALWVVTGLILDHQILPTLAQIKGSTMWIVSYLVIGLAYCFVEGRMVMSRLKDTIIKDWQEAKNQQYYNHSVVYGFLQTTGSPRNDAKPDVSINKSSLAGCLLDWTLFWPAYLLNLVLGDLLDVIFRRIATWIAAYFNGFVKRYFDKAFAEISKV